MEKTDLIHFNPINKKSVGVEWGVGAKKKGQSHDFPISLNTQLSIKQLF